MKTILAMVMIFILILALSTFAFADGPFLVSDPQEGVETYRILFPDLAKTIDSQAQDNGMLKYDLSTWDGPPGWHNGEARACASYEVEDTASGNTSTVEKCSEGSLFKLKIPKVLMPVGYKLQQ